MASYMAGGSGLAAAMSPEALEGLMAASMARTSGPPPSATPAVKPKCRNCGSLEDEDAT